ncbi:hypothetical protein LEP1GSC038_3925 [Leptospira weilii str. 2006001855]|uniref:Uncharacterized protein n=2 Tax=Leptospira TaxID=171 RepID=V6IBK7_9LEPT|nr:hypothetical protein LEP1GSC038_3925 [Leptospira weilii str. 2006001855]EQA61513.1 hypothetical protein LEP1GSC062_2662 [Leptospira alexanderi serovar Manhao 3 str. L 60]
MEKFPRKRSKRNAVAKELGPFNRRPKGRHIYYKFIMYVKFRANRVCKNDFFL